MNPPAHIAVRIALLQELAVIAGVLLTRAAFMVNGYPESDLNWSNLALVIRNYGFLLILVPLLWIAVATYLETYGPGNWSVRWTVASGLSVFCMLVGLLLWSSLNTYHWHKTPLQPW